MTKAGESCSETYESIVGFVIECKLYGDDTGMGYRAWDIGHMGGEGGSGTSDARIYVNDKAIHRQRSSDGGASDKRRCHRRRLERRFDPTVADTSTGIRKRASESMAGRRAGGEESAGANESKVTGTDDHALTGTRKLDRTPRHRQDVHRYAKCPGR